MIDFSAYKFFLLFFTIVIFILPIRFFGLTLLNEPVLVLSFFSSFSAVFIYWKNITINHFNFLFFSFLVSLLFFSILLIKVPDEIVLKDFVEVFKPLIYGFIFVFGMLLSPYLSEKGIIKYVVWAVVFSVLFSALVFIPPAFPLLDMYKGRTSDAVFNFHFFRFSGTLGFPGGFGYWLVLCLQLILFAYYKKILTIRSFLPVYALGLFGLIFTGSRGAAIIFILSNLLFFIGTASKKKTFFLSIIFVFLLAAFIVLLLSGDSEVQAISHFQKILDGTSGGTFGHRASELERLFFALAEGEFLGQGPNNIYIKSNYGPIESVYYFYGYKFGLVGLTAYLSLVLFFLYLGFKLFVGRQTLSLPYVFVCWALLNLVVAGVSNSITEEYKSFYIFFFLSGVIYQMYFRSSHKR